MINKKISWPAENLRYLLKACIHEDEKSARQTWEKWLSPGSVDNATWAEFRLLAYMAGRIKKIDPDSNELPRLEGIRRFVWAKNQIRLDRCIQVIDMLHQAGISIMLLKGMARIATNPSLASARFVRDIDILVHSNDLLKACDTLIENGWRPVCGTLPGKTRAEAFSKILPVNDRFNIDNNNFHVDIHRSVIHYGSTGTFDDVFWDRCKEGNIRGRIVKIPSETDQFLIAILHATVFDPDRPVDWVIDAMDASKYIDWQILTREIDKRCLGAAVATMLEYLEQDMGLEIPGTVKSLIERDSRNILFNQEVYAYWRLPENRVWYGDVFQIIAEWVRSRHCRYKVQQNRKTLWKGKRLFNEGKSILSVNNTDPSVDYCIFLLSGIEQYDCIIDIRTSAMIDNDLEFDLLLQNTWIGRLLIPAYNPGKPVKSVVWRFEIPLSGFNNESRSDAELRLLFINEDGNISDKLPDNIKIAIQVKGNPSTIENNCLN